MARDSEAESSSIQCVVAAVGQNPVGAHDGRAGRHIFRNHGIRSHRGSAANVNPSQDLRARTDINTVLHVRCRSGEVTSTQSDLVSYHHVIPDFGSAMHYDAIWVRKKNGF